MSEQKRSSKGCTIDVEEDCDILTIQSDGTIRGADGELYRITRKHKEFYVMQYSEVYKRCGLLFTKRVLVGRRWQDVQISFMGIDDTYSMPMRASTIKDAFDKLYDRVRVHVDGDDGTVITSVKRLKTVLSTVVSVKRAQERT